MNLNAKALLLTLLIPGLASAQLSEVKEILRKVQSAYQQPVYLSFTVKYTYANQGNPNLPVDTLTGEIEMDKNRTCFTTGGVVNLVTDRYSLRISPENRIIYLSKPTHSPLIDPVTSLDTILSHIEHLQTSVFKERGLDRIEITLPPGFPYTRVTIAADAKTGFLDEMTYDIYTAGLVDKDQLEGPQHSGPYEAKGRVTIHFYQYQHGQFGDKLFDTDQYFTRVGNSFQPGAMYKNYQIFLASSSY